MSMMKPSRRVTISPKVKVHEILTIHDYTPCEISASWYDEEEMKKITKRCFKILQKYDQEGQRGSSKYCMRGLEGHTTTGSISKRNNRSASFEAVFEEQERQSWNQENTGRNVQAISDAYRRSTSSCQMWAQVVGKRDEQAAEAHRYEERHEEETILAPQVSYSHTREKAICLRRGSSVIGEPASTAVVSARAA